ncbi:MAG: hypothetical protein FWD55_05865, partial [Propionibacteriaceae bacterium]|nr:hypothetical protein [Propionibacteriaceae bacterium]
MSVVTASAKKPRARTIVLICLAVVLVTAGGIGIYTWSSLTAIMPGGGITEPINGRYNIVLLGSDATQERWVERLDS